MDRERPSIRQLRYLVTLAETLSFRRAAEACGISQPALSGQIRALERILGVPLFERDHRDVACTDAGLAAAARARRILADLDEVVESVRGCGEPLSGPLRIGVIPTIAPYALPKAVPALKQRFPSLEPWIVEDRTDRLIARLAGRELDVALLAMEADLGAMRCLPLYFDRFLVAVPPGHRLAGRKRVRIAELDASEVLLLQDGHCLRDQVLAICDAPAAGRYGDFRATSLTTLIRMVEAGLGMTLLPETAVPVEVGPDSPLRLVAFAGRPPGRTVALAWRPASSRTAEFLELAAALREFRPCGRPIASRLDVRRVRRAFRGAAAPESGRRS